MKYRRNPEFGPLGISNYLPVNKTGSIHNLHYNSNSDAFHIGTNLK